MTGGHGHRGIAGDVATTDPDFGAVAEGDPVRAKRRHG
jgi:hypothetical protein